MDQKQLSDLTDRVIKILGTLSEAESALRDAQSETEALSREIYKEWNDHEDRDS